MPDPQFASGEAPSAAKLQLLGNEVPFTPVLTAATTNPALGSSPQQEAVVWRNGNKIELWAAIEFGTGSTAGSGQYQVAVPAGLGWGGFAINVPVGEWRSVQGGTVRTGTTVLIPSADHLVFEFEDGTFVNDSTPIAWADGHFLELHASYYSDIS